jgi:DNA-binding transcriptional LysR family regulator
MVRKIDWESQIGRRLRLRDLHVFCTVMQRGSMAQAATHLGVSQPAVSEIIAGLEHALDVRLFDRSRQGVAPTIYGRALVKRATVVFDELKQSIKDLEFLADPTVGDVRIGCPESLAASILPPVIEQFSQRHPNVVVHVNYVASPPRELPELRERTLDALLDRVVPPFAIESDDLNVEVLFEDVMVVAAGMQSPWARRRKIDLAELIDEPWILPPTDSWNYTTVADAFRARGLPLPKVRVVTFSVHLRNSLLTTGRFLTAYPSSVLRLDANRHALKVLPVDIPARPWPMVVVTLKNRTLSPVVQLFIDHLRTFTKSLAAKLEPAQKSA